MKSKRLIILSLIISLLLPANLPFMVTKAADNYGSSSGHPIEVTTDGSSFSVDNPNYDDSTMIADNAPTVFSSFLAPVVSSTIYADKDALLAAMREMCILRQGDIVLTCYCENTDIVDNLNSYVVSHLFDETSNPKMGDYLYWNFSSYEGNGKISVTDDGDWLYTVDLDINFLSTAAQEEEIDAEITKLLSSSGAIGSKDLSDDYHKISAVYDYEIDYYTYHNGEIDDDKYEHSTHSAIMANDTVCQGYATAFYRLVRTMGINSRIIASSTHGWNIVQLDGMYYYIDATWGDTPTVPGSRDAYFLKGSDNFPNTGAHASKSNYQTASFKATYPVSISDYKYEPTTTEASTETSTEISTEASTEVTTEVSTETSTESTTEVSTEESTDTSTESTTENNTTEASTEENTEASTEENTTESTTEDSTTETSAEDSTTESSTESSTEEKTPTPDINTEDSTTENDAFLEDGTLLYEDEYIIIVTDDENSDNTTEDTPLHETSGNPTTEEWETSEHENPNYTVGTVAPEQTTQPAVSTTTTTTTVVDSADIPYTEQPTVAPESIITQYYVNSIEMTNNSVELEEAVTSFEIISEKDYTIKFINETGEKEVTNKIDSKSAIQAIQISDADFWYSVKTKELGWLDYTKGEMTGVLSMDDYIVGIRISDKDEAKNFSTIITGACRDYADYKKVPLYYTIHSGDDWDGIITNGAINSTETNLNAIRIYSDKEISYKVKLGDAWLKPVTNWVLAGNPFSEESINGFSITGDNLKFRVLDSDNVWSDWYKSGESIELTGDTVIKDIQIYQ